MGGEKELRAFTTAVLLGGTVLGRSCSFWAGWYDFTSWAVSGCRRDCCFVFDFCSTIVRITTFYAKIHSEFRGSSQFDASYSYANYRTFRRNGGIFGDNNRDRNNTVKCTFGKTSRVFSTRARCIKASSWIKCDFLFVWWMCYSIKLSR